MASNAFNKSVLYKGSFFAIFRLVKISFIQPFFNIDFNHNNKAAMLLCMYACMYVCTCMYVRMYVCTCMLGASINQVIKFINCIIINHITLNLHINVEAT